MVGQAPLKHFTYKSVRERSAAVVLNEEAFAGAQVGGFKPVWRPTGRPKVISSANGIGCARPQKNLRSFRQGTPDAAEQPSNRIVRRVQWVGDHCKAGRKRFVYVAD